MAGNKIAELLVELRLEDEKYYRGLNEARKESASFVGGLTGMFGKITGALAAVGAFQIGKGILGFFQESIAAAANWGESINKAQKTFGDESGNVIKMVEGMADKFGLLKTSTLDAAAGLGLMFKASGLEGSKVSELSQQFVKLASDTSSLFNIPVEEALEKMRAGLAGEAEPLRTLGVMLSEQAVSAEAARMGFEKLGKGYSEGAKVQARAALIARGLSVAMGDMEDTAGSLTNQERNLTGQVENMKIAFGESLLPIMSQTLPVLTDMAHQMGEFAKDHSADIKKNAEAIGAFSAAVLQLGEGYAKVQGQNIMDVLGMAPGMGEGKMSKAAVAKLMAIAPTAGVLGPIMEYIVGEQISAMKGSAAIPLKPEMEAKLKADAEKRARGRAGGIIFNPAPEGPAAPPPMDAAAIAKAEKAAEKVAKDEAAARERAEKSLEASRQMEDRVRRSARFTYGATGVGERVAGSDEERLKALQEQKSIIAGLIPEVVQRSSQLFTEGGSMEQQFQQKILEQTDKQDEANKLLKAIDEGIAKLNENALKKATEKGWAMIAPAGAAK